MRILKVVQAGAALLDKELGPGWEDLIDLDTLRLESSCNCVVGQLRRKAKTRAKMTEVCYGFPPQYGFDILGRGPSYETLTRNWKRLIGARRIEKIKAQAGIEGDV